jgi:hypothetical protein
MYMRRALLLWPGVVAAAVQLGRGSYVALVTPMDAANAVDYGALRAVWKSTSVSGAPDNSSLSHFSAIA